VASGEWRPNPSRFSARRSSHWPVAPLQPGRDEVWFVGGGGGVRSGGPGEGGSGSPPGGAASSASTRPPLADATTELPTHWFPVTSCFSNASSNWTCERDPRPATFGRPKRRDLPGPEDGRTKSRLIRTTTPTRNSRPIQQCVPHPP
jgi:hypothetical protein